MASKKGQYTQTERQVSEQRYRDDAYPGGLKNAAARASVNEDPRARREVGTMTQTNKGHDSLVYERGAHPVGSDGITTYGARPSDISEAMGAHKEFRKALYTNVNGLGFKDNPSPNGKMWNQNDWVGGIAYNPSSSEKQRRFMGAELARAQAGQKTQTGMSKAKLREFARKPKGGYK